ncbi:MAG TPA: hypothetical protein VNT24_09045 [Propionibacteriaceae bacterium]|nr:hypothetical protein [Propionibacteriaceae bacterium]
MTLAGQILVVGLVLLDVLPPSPSTTGSGSEVYPQAGNGFAAYLIGGFFGLGVIVVAMILLSLKPKRADPGGRRS